MPESRSSRRFEPHARTSASAPASRSPPQLAAKMGGSEGEGGDGIEWLWLHGQQKMTARAQGETKRLFATADRAVLSSARVLLEGVTFEGGVDMVVFADPKQSAVDIQQGVFRMLYKETGSCERGVVMVPHIEGEVKVWSAVLTALSEIDDELSVAHEMSCTPRGVHVDL